MLDNEDLTTGMVGRRALSKEGHAAISMRGGDDRWIQIQKNTFTNWVNEQLREKDSHVEDLQFDFMDGTRLCYLVESLQGKRVKGKVVQNPQNQHQMIHNAAMALTAISDDNVKLVNIGPEDIVNGNLKLILGLIWHLILRYQIGKTKFPPKKLMLAWLQAVIPDCQVGNFTRDWNDGVALHALLDYCKPGLAPNWRQLNRNNKVENCRNAMQLAKQHFDIPLVLRPEDLSSPDLDELSGMTYLSYYMKYDSPGYRATLNWVRNAIPEADVNNFTTDWNDGRALCKLVRKMGGSSPANPQGTPVENLQAGIDAGKRLGVDPILSAKELAEVSEEHLGMMAYAASFTHLKPSKPPSEKVALSGDFNNVMVGNEKNFGLQIQDDKVRSSDIKAVLEGPSSKIPVRLDWRGNAVEGHFKPKEAGRHQLVVYCQDEIISSCPVSFNVTSDPNRVVVHKIDKACLGVPTELRVDTSSAGQGDVTVEATSPSGKRFDLPLSARNGMFHSTFTPQEAGDWKISVMYANEHVRGSPYTVNVYDPNAVKVYGLEGGAVGKALNFTADCSQAGEGNLEVNVVHNGMTVPAKVTEEGHGIYKVDFVPKGAGIYKVEVLFNGTEVKGSPYTLEIVDSNLVTASGEGLSLVPVNKVAAFNIDTKAAGGGEVSVDVVAPSGKNLPVRIVPDSDHSYKVEYTPEEIGDHSVKVLYHGHPVRGNPFQVKVYDAGKVIVHKMPKTVAMGHPVNFEIDASEAGSGNLEIMVNGGRVPCQVENKGKRRFLASFVPEDATNHVVEMKFNQVPLAGSPWKVGVVDPRKVAVLNNSSSNLKHVPMHKVVSFYIETDGIPSQELDVVVKAPSGKAVSSRLFPEGTGYRVEYTPTEVGTYTIQIFFAGSPVAGTPFSVKSYDSTSIQVSEVPNGMVGKPVDFFIDVTKAGEGQLEIMVNNGNLPNTVTHQRPGVYKVSFTPVEAGTHYVEILFNGERLPGSPYTCQVIDTSRVNVEVRRLVPVRESSHFVIQSQSVSGFDTSDLTCVVEITSPSGRKVSSRLIGSLHSGTFRAEYMPMEIGTHKVNVSFGGIPVKGSPFQVKTYDASRVRVSDLPNQSIVGIPTKFEVDASEAGEGALEVVVTNNGVVVPSQARPIRGGVCEVGFMPRESGRHQIQVLYNKDRVPGSPFVMNVYDSSKISASGEGLNSVLCHHPTHFNIHGGGGEGGDIGVKIKGPDGRDLPVRVKESPDGYRVEWTPNSVGDHKVYVSYAEMQLKGSPFTPRVYDPSGVTVRHDGHGKIGKPVALHLDAAKAGAGNLEIFVTSKGETVPNFVRQEGEAKFEVTFTPQSPENHAVTVNFNGDPVPGSPFQCKIIDSSRVHVSGDGLRLVPANVPTSFKVDPQTTDPASCNVEIIAPSGRHIPARVTGGRGTPFRVEYTPTETGQYAVHVFYDDTEVKGSPFSSDVYNPDLVRITHKSKAYVNKPVSWEVDTSKAGPGSLDVDLKCRGAVVRSNVREVTPGRYEVTFTPREHSTHTLALLYNGDTIPGSPHHVDIIDSSQVSMTGEGLRTAQVYKESHFEIDSHGPADEEIKAVITGPSGVEVPCRISRHGNLFRVDFTPHEVGPHSVQAFYAGMPVSGGPVTCMTFDPSQVRITDVDKTGRLEREIGFIVDASAAGEGEVEATVTHYGRMVRTWRENVGVNRHRYVFVPTEPGPYDIDVRFNNERTPGSPLLIQVEEEKPTTIRINFQGAVAHQAQRKNQFLLEMDGAKVNLDDLDIIIRAPNGEQIPARIIPQSDGDYRVEWTPTIPGRYTIDVLFGGRKIQGSPFYVDVFDISRIRVENIRYGSVSEMASFDVDYSHAGKAEHTVRVIGPSGHHVHCEVQETRDGQHVRFEPHEPGRYKIYITYGGLDVPGSPFIIDVDEGRMPTANGDGLYRGEEDRPATFYVDARGLRGELGVQVEGPNSIAKCNIEPERDGVYAVTYVPVEVGKYRAIVKWNGKEIPGSPFHPKVVDARKVKVVGGWQHFMDSNDRVHLLVDEEKRIPFDVSEAGPGILKAEVRGPGGKIPCHVEENGSFRRTICFTPREEGDHHIYAYWSDHTLVNAPFHGYAVSRRRSPDPTKVILSGRGLKEAIVHREAEFQIDGSEAGPGRPDVQLTGLKRNIPVRVSSLGGGRYRCTYIPESAGAYLLHITWNDRQLRGSPFKVNVINAHYPQKVVVTGEGLKGGVMGRDINVIIDTRKAGPGELTAHCMGPHLVAYCELEDMRDGTYKLNIRPQEPGRHILQIKYGGEHVLGSPYVLRVGAQPDASKVRVSGPGVEHGILANFESRFIVETRGAGAGQLTVRIRGPKGAFQVEMLRDSQKDRTILCRFDPTETGLYQIFVKWSGVDVPGSPFQVYIVDSQQELMRVMQGQIPSHYQGSTLNRSVYNSEYSSWREEDNMMRM